MTRPSHLGQSAEVHQLFVEPETRAAAEERDGDSICDKNIDWQPVPHSSGGYSGQQRVRIREKPSCSGQWKPEVSWVSEGNLLKPFCFGWTFTMSEKWIGQNQLIWRNFAQSSFKPNGENNVFLCRAGFCQQPVGSKSGTTHCHCGHSETPGRWRHHSEQEAVHCCQGRAVSEVLIQFSATEWKKENLAAQREMNAIQQHSSQRREKCGKELSTSQETKLRQPSAPLLHWCTDCVLPFQRNVWTGSHECETCPWLLHHLHHRRATKGWQAIHWNQWCRSKWKSKLLGEF